MSLELFAANLHHLRTSRGWSQQQLANRVQISKAAVYYLEQARREPTRRVVLRLSEVFNLSTDSLLKEDLKQSV